MRTTVRGILHDPRQRTSRPVTIGCDTATRVLEIADDGTERAVAVGRLAAAGGGFGGGALHLSWEESGERWTVTVPDRGDVEALVATLAAAAPPGLRGTLSYLERKRRRAWLSSQLWIGVAITLVALLAVAAAMAIVFRDALLDAAVRRVPLAVDAELGAQAYAGLAASGRVVERGAAVRAIDALGARLGTAATDAPAPFRFVVVRNPSLNAFAAPGGLVVVHTGLIAAADSPDEIAGVLAHEMTHVLHRHSMRALVGRLGIAAVLRLLTGGSGDVTGALARAAGELGALRMSRGQEADADRGALALLRAARLSPRGLIGFFDRLARESGSAIPALFSTHPPAADRAARLTAELKRSGSWPVAPLAVDWTAARRAAKEAR